MNALSNKPLDEKLSQLISFEREMLIEIVLHIREVASRKMYLDFGKSSIFDYFTQRMGYANARALRRIDAARLSMDVLAVIDHIESGDLSIFLLKSLIGLYLAVSGKIELSTYVWSDLAYHNEIGGSKRPCFRSRARHPTNTKQGSAKPNEIYILVILIS